MKLTKEKSSYTIQHKDQVYKGDYDHIFDTMLKLGVPETEIIFATQTLLLSQHDTAEFGDIYKCLIYTKKAVA